MIRSFWLWQARIVAAGGRVFAVRYDDGIDGPARVWLAHADIPGLAMSRSLGDKVAHSAGVSSEPEIFELKLVKGDHLFLVSATDGLWEFITSQEVSQMNQLLVRGLRSRTLTLIILTVFIA